MSDTPIESEPRAQAGMPVPGRRRAATIMLIGGYASLGITIVQGIVLVPLYLHHIGVSVYGAWLGSGGILGWLSLLELGTGSLMIQRMANAYGRRDNNAVGNYFASGVLVQFGLTLLLVLAAASLSAFVPQWMGLHGEEASLLSACFVLAAVAAGLNILNTGVSSLAQAVQRPVFVNISNLLTGVLGLLVTITGLTLGWGLRAIPIGLLVRNGSLLLANGVHALFLAYSSLRIPLRVGGEPLKDLMRMAPVIFLSSLGNSIAAQSEPALIAILISAEAVTVYTITRRAADIIRMLLDRIAGAVFPGFSHLYSESQFERSRAVLTELRSLLSAGGALMFGVYLALNHSFINLWVGAQYFGGNLLTVLIAVSTLLLVSNQLVSYLYGATGDIQRAAIIITVEAFARLALMAVALKLGGITLLPVATIISGLVVKEVWGRLMARRLNTTLQQIPAVTPLWTSPIHGIIWAASIPLGLIVVAGSWGAFVLLGTAYLLGAVILLFAADRQLRLYIGQRILASPLRNL